MLLSMSEHHEIELKKQQQRPPSESSMAVCLQVLVTERDFYEVTVSYLAAVAAQNVSHSEIFFDPQVHTMRGIGFSVFMPGFLRGMQECRERLGISAALLMCFMTELGPSDAETTLDQVRLSMFSIPILAPDTGEGVRNENSEKISQSGQYD
jgi:adenosine deaminase